MIEARNLTRRYGDFTAVDGLSFAVEEGEIVGILGANGAGKTTTIRMVTGFLPPSEGEVSVNGLDLFAEPAAARRQIGYLPETVALYTDMRVEEYLLYRAQLEGLAKGQARAAVEAAIEICLIEDVRRQIIGTLSKGYRQRIGLATAILHDPQVLVLDEPTVGLDPRQIVAIRERIRELGRKHTILLSTHILPEVELLCSRVLVIDRGHVVAQGTPADLRRQWSRASTLTLQLQGEVEAGGELERVPGVTSVESMSVNGDSNFRLVLAEDADPRAEVFRLAVERGWTLLEMHRQDASLEDIFVRITTREEPAEEEIASAEGEAESEVSIDPEPVDEEEA